MTFIDKLHRAWAGQDSLLMVGLDPDTRRFPAELAGRPDAVFEFCRRIVDATAPYACGFKPQIAYFAALGAEDQLLDICRHIHEHHPGLPIVLDAKRGDIGSTAEQYAREAFERYGADAVTVNPYMGRDSVQPYIDYGDRGVIILCRTSNRGGADLQDMRLANGTPLYLHVADQVARVWDTTGQCALVVGATFPEEIAQVRRRVGDMPLLIPGIGAQGGDVQATVRAGRTPAGAGMMINSSRAILYASQGDDWAQAAAQAAGATRDAIRQALEPSAPAASR
ncbi:orotidine-5'-phosphate decarboxylase [uncultured Castellaniella sp.]|uniref:orotidine-5'-phosphate decarboxylase n=1 Tax=uncultured Castellaniella sp. TaxID=647907 RepID=UPI00260F5958|nr:orotidine-5'-phosphate decarboxylase [uncultured Castellaniella sp.]